MHIVRDRVPLNPQYPCMFSSHILEEADNREDSFHWHSYFEITYVRSGTGAYLVNGQKYEMQDGDIIIFNNVEPHGWLVKDGHMEVDVIIFSTEFIADHGDSYEYEFLNPFIERGSNFQNCISGVDNNGREIGRIIQEIGEEWANKEAGYRLFIKSDVLRILTLLLRYYQKDVSSGELLKEKKAAMKRLEEVFRRIEADYSEKLTLEDMAKSVYMSPNYFSSYFRRIVGKSFSEYLSEFRIRKVEEQLEKTGRSVTEIAMECGFRNMSNFYRQYKKATGSKPGDIKKK